MRGSGWQLEQRDGQHDKFYRVTVAGPVVVYRWGRRGSRGQRKVVTANDSRSALGDAYAQGRAKHARGYETVVSETSFEVADTTDPDVIEQAWLDRLVELWPPLGGARRSEKLLLLPRWEDARRSRPDLEHGAEVLEDGLHAVDRQRDLAIVAVPHDAGTGVFLRWPDHVTELGRREHDDDETVLQTALGLIDDPVGEDAANEALAAARLLLQPQAS